MQDAQVENQQRDDAAAEGEPDPCGRAQEVGRKELNHGVHGNFQITAVTAVASPQATDEPNQETLRLSFPVCLTRNMAADIVAVVMTKSRTRRFMC